MLSLLKIFLDYRFQCRLQIASIRLSNLTMQCTGNGYKDADDIRIKMLTRPLSQNL